MNFEIRHGDALDVLRTLPEGLAQMAVTSPPYYGLRDYGTGEWSGGDPSCDHVERVARRDANPERWAERIEAGDRPGTGAGSAVSPVYYRTKCGRCGADRADDQIGLEQTPQAYVDRLVEVFDEVRRVLADDGTLWLNIGDTFATSGGPGWQGRSGDRANRRFTLVRDQARPKELSRRPPEGIKPKDLIGIPWMLAFALRDAGWWLRSPIVWHKPNPMPESVDDRPTKSYEMLFLLAKSERYWYDSEAIAEPAVESASGNLERKAATERGCPRDGVAGNVPWQGKTRNRRDVWTIAPEPSPLPHFAMFPQALVEPCVLAGSRVGDLVLDPFAGTGTVGVVALRHGRRFLGVELNPKHVAMARERIAGPLFA